MNAQQLKFLVRRLEASNQEYMRVLSEQHVLIQIQGSVLMAQAWAWAQSELDRGRPEVVDEAIQAWDALAAVGRVWKARAEKAEEQFGVLLEGLESCGWPCRLVELPVERQLAECRDRARDTKKEAALRETAEAQPAIAKAEGDEWRARSERAETELREVLSVLEGGGPATETLFALAQRGTAKKIRALLGLTLAPEVGS